MASNTYVALQTTVVSGTSTNSITFTSIPATYTDLVIVSNFQHSTDGACYIRFNSDSGSNYSRTSVTGDGSSAGSERVSNQTYSRIAQTGAGIDQMTITQVMNYANTTTYKTFLNRWNRPSAYVFADVDLWRSTAAITAIEISHSNGGYFTAGSTFTLYGVAAASVGAKATGGTIYSDASYFYHVFAGNGTFTPSQSISADVLVVAGGGGGSSSVNYAGGGGGAGGLLAFTSQSLSATGYTCTIGAGGGTGSNGANSQFGALTAAVGGGAGGYGNGSNGNSGGSGGGGGSNGSSNGTGGAGTSGQGYAGGNGNGLTGATSNAGGGGGAGGAGNTATQNVKGGDGGIGATSSFINLIGAATGFGVLSSNNYYFAGGGGGSGENRAIGIGGIGGGGNGSNSSTNPVSGSSNTGGGAGGTTTGGISVAGGSGVVIVRYAK